jgi:hypothetical protein
MKPLLRKITNPFLIYVLIVLGISVPVYYVVIDGIWKSELDEHNKIIVEKTAFELNSLRLSDEKLQHSITIWNSIQPSTDIRKPGANDSGQRQYLHDRKQKSYVSHENIDRFRCLSTGGADQWCPLSFYCRNQY